MSGKENQKTIFKEWLEKLQQESWQLELLISGFAIFGIYQSRTLITDLEFAKNSYLDDYGFWLNVLVLIFKKGWLIFFINLLIHVVLRGLWIGAIGLRYVSAEIEYDRFQYADIFSRFLKKSVGSYDDFIEKLEKVCSVIFAYTFLLFLLFMSFMLFLMQIGFIGMMIQEINPSSTDVMTISGFAVIIYFVLGSFVFFDLLSLGGFKKIKNPLFSKVYFYLYRFFGFMTLSFLYRPLLYNFIDNNYTKKLFYFSIPYIAVVGFGETVITQIKNPYKADHDYLISTGHLLDENYYDDLRIMRLNEFPNEERIINKKYLSWVSMEQYEITKSLSSFFLKLDKNLVKFMEKDSTISPYFKSGYVFTWFNSHILTDMEIEKIREQKNRELADLYSIRRQINKELRKNKQAQLVQSLDSVKQLVNEKEELFEQQIRKYLRAKSERVKEAYLTPYTFYIDSTELKISESFFFNHPHYDEEGIKCYFSTDSLQSGLHEFKVIRKFISRTQEISKDSIILPFIKI